MGYNLTDGQKDIEGIPKVFISHSNQDAKLAASLVDLLGSSLTLTAQEIRCTSVDGHRLPAGANVDEQLRQELLGAPVFIGLISKASFGSAYVLFELGARWGVQKHLIPLLAHNVDPSILEGPIARYNALSCSSGPQIHQLVQNVAKELGIHDLQPAAYQRKIDEILSMEVQAAGGETADQPPSRGDPFLMAPIRDPAGRESDVEVDAYADREFREDFRGDLKRNWYYSGTWNVIDEGEGRVLRVTNAGIGGIAKPCLSWTNYVFEFDTRIENRNSSWIIRATETLSNYAMVQCRLDAIRPLFRVDDRWHDLSWSDRNIQPLPVVLELRTWFHVCIEVREKVVTVTLTLDDVGEEFTVFSRVLLQSPPAPADYSMGSVGFRESSDECACFRNVRVKRLL